MRLVVPHLTVFNVRQNESAAQTGQLLAQMLRGEPVEKRQIFLSPLLEEHGSTGPPRGKAALTRLAEARHPLPQAGEG